jgi:hypothetical protein
MKQSDCSDKGKNLYSFFSDNFSNNESSKELNETLKQNASLTQKEMNAVSSLDESLISLPKSLPESQQSNNKMNANREGQDFHSKDTMERSPPLMKNDDDDDDDDDSIELVDISTDRFGNDMLPVISNAQENRVEYSILPLTNLAAIYPTAWYHCSSSITPSKKDKDNTFDFEIRYNQTFTNEQQIKSFSVHHKNHFTTNQFCHDTRKLRRILALNGEPKRIIRRSTQKLNVVFGHSINNQKQKKIK